MRRAKSATSYVTELVEWLTEKNGAQQREICEHFGWCRSKTVGICGVARESGLIESVHTAPSVTVYMVPNHAEVMRNKLSTMRLESARISGKQKRARLKERVKIVIVSDKHDESDEPDEPDEIKHVFVTAGTVPPPKTTAVRWVFEAQS